MNDTAQINLREPAQTDWQNYNTGQSSYIAPPPALDASGKSAIYFGKVGGVTERVNQFAVDAEGNPYLNFLLDPITLVDSGKYDGYVIRFTEASVKPFEKNNQPIKGNPSKLGNFLRACGAGFKPQTNADWRAAVKAVVGKRFGFTVDWQAYNKDTGERIKGYLSFPEDSERPGERKSILKQGDTYFVKEGNVYTPKTVQSEVLFANAVLRFFIDPTRGTK